MTPHRSSTLLLLLFVTALASAVAPGVEATDSWKQCAEEGQVCNFAAGSWAIRFGAPADGDKGDSWYYYTEYNDSAPFTVRCDQATFGNPRHGRDKVCQYRQVYDSPGADYLGCSVKGSTTECGYQAASDAQWSECAKDGHHCTVDTGGLVALRFGSYEEGGAWAVRNWSSTGDEMECSSHAWKYDPAKGHKKVCEWAPLPDYAMRAVAYQWKAIVGTCDNCSLPTVTTQVGVSLTEGTSTTSGFSASVGGQISESTNIGVGIGVVKVSETVGLQLSANLAANWSSTASRTTQVSESITESFTCDFAVPDGHNVLVYQFVTSSYRIGAGDVDVGDIQDASFVCILTPVGEPVKVPACLPNYFDPSDPTGQKCLPGGGLIVG